MRFTVFNSSYIKRILSNNNYYNDIYGSIFEGMKDEMVSSGFSSDILNDIYSKDDVKKDINLFVDNFYDGKKYEVNTDKIKDNLNNNINSFLEKQYFVISNSDDISSFVDSMVKIYNDNISLWNMLNGFSNKFYKINSYINTATNILGILLIVLSFVLIRLFKFKYFSSVIGSAGLIMLLIKIFIFEKVDADNILVISKYFSSMFRIIFNNIGNYIFVSSIICIILCILLSLFIKKDK